MITRIVGINLWNMSIENSRLSQLKGPEWLRQLFDNTSVRICMQQIMRVLVSEPSTLYMFKQRHFFALIQGEMQKNIFNIQYVTVFSRARYFSYNLWMKHT